jgi:hypothetical protein
MPEFLRLSNYNRITMLEGFFWNGGRMNSSHDHRNSTGAKMFCQGIGPGSGWRHGRQAHEVCFELEVHILHGLVD